MTVGDAAFFRLDRIQLKVLRRHDVSSCQSDDLREQGTRAEGEAAQCEKLAAAQLIIGSRAAGTLVADRPRSIPKTELSPIAGSFIETYLEMTQGPAFFQMGVPASSTMPSTLLARMRASAVRAELSAPPLYPDIWR